VQFPHTAGVQGEYVVKIAAKNVELIGLSITSNHPLTSDNNKAFPDFGVILSADAGVDISGGRVHRCHIHHVGTAIERQGAASFPTRRFDITECEIDSIWFYGMNIVWNVGGFNVSYNILRGVMVGDVHTNQGNGIWLGNNGQLAQIHKNTVSHFARHGIEYWNAQTEAGTLNGNRGGKITGNNVFSMGPGSFGISAFGTGGLHVVQNSVSECAIGIEIYNDPVNKARNLIALNVIENIYGQGISLNNTKNTTVVDNIIGFCQPFNPAVGNAVGIQIIYGAENLVVRGNQFKNAGHRSILLNGRMALISAVEAEAADATFTVTAILPLESGDGSDPLFNVGRRVYIRDVVGVVNGAESVNDRYYKITWRSADRLQFRCGFDSRGHTAYTSGGRMQEAYTNVLIEGNTFHYDQEILPTQWSAALYIHDFQKVIVRRNVYWKKIGVPITNFIFVNSGELYIDDSGTIVPSFGEFTGSNMIITSKTGPEF